VITLLECGEMYAEEIQEKKEENAPCGNFPDFHSRQFGGLHAVNVLLDYFCQVLLWKPVLNPRRRMFSMKAEPCTAKIRN